MKDYVNMLAELERASTLPEIKHLGSRMSDCSSDRRIQGDSPSIL